MKLWLLRAREDLPDDPEQNPWEPWYDKTFGMVIRAETESDARQMAQKNGADENYRWHVNGEAIHRVDQTPWLDAAYSTCEELTPGGDPDVILVDHAAA